MLESVLASASVADNQRLRFEQVLVPCATCWKVVLLPGVGQKRDRLVLVAGGLIAVCVCWKVVLLRDRLDRFEAETVPGDLSSNAVVLSLPASKGDINSLCLIMGIQSQIFLRRRNA